MKQQSLGAEVRLLPSLALNKQVFDREYLLSLKDENLLFSFYTEAGLSGWHVDKPVHIHWGWDGPLSHIRGTFTGHWLSACARLYDETGDEELKARAMHVVGEIRRCQEVNGNGWAFPIPEKYLYQLRRGVHFWAPQYVCHKVMMGLLDVYVYLHDETAMQILKGCTQWFWQFTEETPRHVMDDMMDAEETGAMMEFWADLYAVTGDEKHKILMERYERPRLTEPLWRGEDVLTNMHANATVPEIHGCARAYEVTGDERYLTIVKNYWQQAVTKRGMFVTGGQTAGEVWTPPHRQSARLNHNNQEHCVVYNMIRLADYLYRQTGDKEYLDYIELNLINGLFAQAFWKDTYETLSNAISRDEGIVTYYLPLEAGSHKNWGSRTEDFWCCHCTAVQGPSRYREWLWYRGEDHSLTLAQFLPNRLIMTEGDKTLNLTLSVTDRSGECVKITGLGAKYPTRPESDSYTLQVEAPDGPVNKTLRVRLPGWLSGPAVFTLNGEACTPTVQDGYACLSRSWQTGDTLQMEFPKALRCCPLEDDPNTVAFRYGPVVLAGLSEARLLHGDCNDPSTMLVPHNEREWGNWNIQFRTVNQDFGFVFRPLYDIGRETYTIYYQVV